MISCADAVRRLWEYLHNDLDAVDRGSVEDHLAFCRRCCGELEFARALGAMLRSAGSPSVPPQVEGRLHDFVDGLDREAP